MNKKLLLLSLLFSFSAQASDLVIEDGQTYTVTDNQRELYLKKLIIGNNATIKFASDVTYWDLNADYVEIGRDVVIDGHGVDGANGLAGTAIIERAGDCERGKQGNDGKSGERGGNGVDIQMKLAIARFGSMKINIDGGKGGKGGNGGDGGKGQQGGVTQNCNPTDGGDGGNAGFGGAGGSGGKLTVVLSAATQGLNLMALSHQIETSADAGSAGKGGKGGDGGSGSEGQFINQKTLTGDKKWVSGGSKGKTGLAGEAGKPGSEGRVFVGGGELNVMAMEAKSPVVAPVQSNGLEELKAQIRLIQQRLDALEKKQH